MTLIEEMFGLPVETRDDLPEGWVFVERDGVLDPVAALEPGILTERKAS